MSALRFEPLGTIAVANMLGEGVVWDEHEHCFWWTDILDKKLFRLAWPARALTTYDLPYRLGSFGLTTQPGTLVAAFEQGVAWYEVDSGQLTWIARPALPPGVRFNDGRVDRHGRFWAGTMVEDSKAAGGEHWGCLYRLDADGSLSPQVTGLQISNSLCWSADGATLYHADSPQRRIDAYLVEAGGVGERRTFAVVEAGSVPDGSTIDAEGRLWNARWGGSRVAVHGADGTLAGTLELPVSQPSCVALGGADLDIVAVTTARVDLTDQDLTRQPAAGHLFLYQTNARGLPENRVIL